METDFLTYDEWLKEDMEKYKKECPEFNKWAKSFEEDEANTLVSMEFGNDWGYDTRTEITEDEAEKYANKLLQVILDNWYK